MLHYRRIQRRPGADALLRFVTPPVVHNSPWAPPTSSSFSRSASSMSSVYLVPCRPRFLSLQSQLSSSLLSHIAYATLQGIVL